jgi:hypothetical protein
MKIYIATRYSRAAEAERLASALRRLGHHGVQVTSTWHISPPPGETYEGLKLAGDEGRLRTLAELDLSDLASADTLIALTGGDGGGSRHAEYGAALILGHHCYVVGEPEHTFHHLNDGVFPTADALLVHLIAQFGAAHG